MLAGPQQLLRQLGRLVPASAALHDGDATLLQRFAAAHDEAAFTALVLRHGPMVLGVCRRVLHDVRDAEDVLQATFLVLARKAATLRRPEALAAWLHGTAHRLALRCRRADQRRRLREAQAQPQVLVRNQHDPLDDLSARELLAIVDEEVQRLPEAYRLPVILCCLDGHTREEAARLLGWTPGAVKGRLERGRLSLQQRLSRRGLAAPAVLATLELARGLAPAAVPLTAAHTLAHAAAVGRAGGDVVAAGISVGAAALAREALRGAGALTLKLGAALLLALGLLLGAGAPAPQQPAAKQPAAQPANPPPPQVRPAPVADLHEDPLPPGARARLGTVRFRQGSGHIGALAYSPDGKMLASAGSEPTIYLWDAATGRCLRRLAGHENRTSMISWSPDGKVLASTGQEYDTSIRLWDVATGKELRRLDGDNHTTFACFSPDGKLLASLGRGWQPRLWDVATGREVRSLSKTPKAPCHLGFSPDGKTVTVGSHDGMLRLWDTATGKERLGLLCGDGVLSAKFSPDGQLLATGTIGGRVSLWDPSSGRQLRTWPRHEGYVYSLAFTADGRILLVSWFHSSLLLRRPGSIKLFDTTTGKEVRSLQDCDGCMHGMVLSPDGKTVAAAEGGCIRRWDFATGKALPPHDGHTSNVYALALAPDGKTVFSAGEDGTIRRWDTATGRQLGTLDGHRSAVWRVRMTPDGKLLGSLGTDRKMYLWEPDGRKPLRELRAPPGGEGLRATALAPDGRTAATAADGVGVILWDVATAKELRRLAQGHMVFNMTFAPDGKTLATGGSEQGSQRLCVWDVATGKLLGSDKGLDRSTALTFSPDGAWLAVSMYSHHAESVRLYDARAREVRRFRGHKGDAHDVAFSPDGRTLASAGADHTVRLWEVATGQERHRLEGHTGWVFGVAFSADGRTLVSASSDTTLLVWDLDDPTRAFRAGKAPTAAELDRRWDELAGTDAARAYRAICYLAAFPKQAVPLLQARLLGQPQGDDKTARWIRELDDRRFAVRERAMAALGKLGRQVEGDLRRALAGAPSEEMRRRLTRLLDALGGAAVSAEPRETLLARRAVELLERLATPEARRLLQMLASTRTGTLAARRPAKLYGECSAQAPDRDSRAFGGRSGAVRLAYGHSERAAVGRSPKPSGAAARRLAEEIVR